MKRSVVVYLPKKLARFLPLLMLPVHLTLNGQLLLAQRQYRMPVSRDETKVNTKEKIIPGGHRGPAIHNEPGETWSDPCTKATYFVDFLNENIQAKSNVLTQNFSACVIINASGESIYPGYRAYNLAGQSLADKYIPGDPRLRDLTSREGAVDIIEAAGIRRQLTKTPLPAEILKHEYARLPLGQAHINTTWTIVRDWSWFFWISKKGQDTAS